MNENRTRILRERQILRPVASCSEIGDLSNLLPISSTGLISLVESPLPALSFGFRQNISSILAHKTVSDGSV